MYEWLQEDERGAGAQEVKEWKGKSRFELTMRGTPQTHWVEEEQGRQKHLVGP